MAGGVPLASRWDAGWDLVDLVGGLFRVGIGSLPAAVRYPVLALGGAFLLYCLVVRWRARRSRPGELAETPPDT
ncbi:hypothetical protein [Streptomyces sp. NPDC048659]|uniref:hypothetical protein n=1 Tax=Streptomyces sp. NPDC048659 TaxID=3155489 RepID=UPI003432B886